MGGREGEGGGGTKEEGGGEEGGWKGRGEEKEGGGGGEREGVRESRSVVSDSLPPCGLYSPWDSPGQNTGVGSHSLLQGIFPTQESNRGSPALQLDSLPAELPGKPQRGRDTEEPNFRSSESRS